MSFERSVAKERGYLVKEMKIVNFVSLKQNTSPVGDKGNSYARPRLAGNLSAKNLISFAFLLGIRWS